MLGRNVVNQSYCISILLFNSFDLKCSANCITWFQIYQGDINSLLLSSTLFNCITGNSIPIRNPSPHQDTYQYTWFTCLWWRGITLCENMWCGLVPSSLGIIMLGCDWSCVSYITLMSKEWQEYYTCLGQGLKGSIGISFPLPTWMGETELKEERGEGNTWQSVKVWP